MNGEPYRRCRYLVTPKSGKPTLVRSPRTAARLADEERARSGLPSRVQEVWQ